MIEHVPKPIDLQPSTQDQWWAPTQNVFIEDDLDITIPRAEIQRLREQQHLGSVASQQETPVTVVEDAVPVTPEVAQMNREQLLFEAFEPQETSKIYSDYDFDAWYGSDEDYESERTKSVIVPKPENSLKEDAMRERGKVTEASLHDAEVNFRGLTEDPVIKKAFDDYSQANPSIYKERDLMKALREDTTLRLKVGSRILEAANNYPYQISKEDKKKPMYPGYSHIQNLNANEYAALLALAMSDGTYKDPGKAMGLQHSRLMEIENGRHRQAAKHILDGKRQWDQWIDRIRQY